EMEGPILLHVVTQKGHGFRPAAEDPVYFHTPPQFRQEGDKAVPLEKSGGKAYTNFARDAIHEAMQRDPRVTVMTAAMCQGNKLEPVRAEFPDRFFDVGICESHAVAFAAGQAKVGVRPIVAIYSTFLQRSYDQIFQEVALQNLPVTFLLDRGGLCGPDGPTHHGLFDMAYMRVFPNLVVMAPGDSRDLKEMLDFSLQHDSPCSIRYPKASAITIDGERAPLELGKAEVLQTGRDGAIVACGALLGECIAAAEMLRDEGLDITVVNARFIKPLDSETILPLVRDLPFVATVEEGCLMGGFGSAVLEAAGDAGIDAGRLRRLGIPDHFIEHGERSELLTDLSLDPADIAQTCRELHARHTAPAR
ncbi:MAG: 1-deoxy-D-xylulose-5-phosphate synthase, partial [Planctomycetes bacterium]|nr:1-deoxy-D-xylulose-5-phosphate synthase [Planctomycetota bacterium]